VAAEVLETGAPGYLEYGVPRPDGERFYQARLVRSSAGEVLVLLRDVTEHRSAEERLRSAAAAKQAFAARVLSVQEAERQHLSRELHDSISQLLLVHRMDAEWLAGQADSDPVRDAAERLCTGLDETLHLVRTLAMDLRPPAIDDLGIDSALGTLCADISRHSGIRCQFEADARTRALPEEIGVILFRIAQEALTNAVRHAQCRNIRVELLQQARTIELRVVDDGVGIPADRLADTTSFGLVGMRERAELVGGHVSIRTGPRDGTSIHALIPYTPYRPGPVNTQAPSREGKP
jgi:two-component system sensor histidine kinase UhpB